MLHLTMLFMRTADNARWWHMSAYWVEKRGDGWYCLTATEDACRMSARLLSEGEALTYQKAAVAQLAALAPPGVTAHILGNAQPYTN